MRIWSLGFYPRFLDITHGDIGGLNKATEGRIGFYEDEKQRLPQDMLCGVTEYDPTHQYQHKLWTQTCPAEQEAG